jgi:hypothetical protein
MSIRGVLTQRASVSRATVTNVNGAPQTAWATVATDVPCLLDPLGQPEDSAVATALQTTEADRTGTLITAPEANIQPADRLTISVPGAPDSTWTVSPFPSLVSDLHSPHHRAWKVREA